MWDFVSSSLEISIQLSFFPFLFFSYCCSLIITIRVMFLVDIISLFFVLLMQSLSCRIDASTLSSIPPSFLDKYILSVSSIGYKALSTAFLSYGPFIEVLPLSISRMVSSILQSVQWKILSLWWDFCNIVWFRVVFSFSWDIIFYFLFHIRLIDGVRFQYSQLLGGSFYLS